MAASGSSPVSESLFAPSGALTGAISSRTMGDGAGPAGWARRGWTGTLDRRSSVDFASSSGFAQAAAIGFGTRAKPSDQSIFSSSRRQPPRASLDAGVISVAQLASMDFVSRQNALNRTAVFGSAHSLSAGTAPHHFMSVGASGVVHNRINPAGALFGNNGHTSRMTAPRSVEYHLDLLSILGTSPKQALRGLLGQPENPSATSFGYLTFSSTR